MAAKATTRMTVRGGDCRPSPGPDPGQAPTQLLHGAVNTVNPLCSRHPRNQPPDIGCLPARGGIQDLCPGPGARAGVGAGAGALVEARVPIPAYQSLRRMKGETAGPAKNRPGRQMNRSQNRLSDGSRYAGVGRGRLFWRMIVIKMGSTRSPRP